MAVTPDQKRVFINALSEGHSQTDAANIAGFSESTAKRLIRRHNIDPKALKPSKPLEIPGPLERHELSRQAARALDDFALFRYRYFGRKSSPWQEHAAEVVAAKLATPQKEFGVVNCPPGSGKSTLFTHDIPAWLTARSRSLRGFIGSSTQTLANSYVGRLRSTLERNIPVQAKSEEIALRLASDADSTLSADYGRFKPLHHPDYAAPPWSKTQFTVEQLGLTSSHEKEATWTAFGRDTGFLGWRVNFVVWDDLVTKAALRTQESIEQDRSWWLDEAQTRLEPGGLLILQGQRLHAEDLYRFCLDMKVPFDDIDGEAFDLGEEQIYGEDNKYFHVVYKAHYDDNCTATDLDKSSHKISAPPYDPKRPHSSGCLLDPMRLPWRELRGVMGQPLSNYRVVYQQEDVDPTEVLVPKIWIQGGYDHTSGNEYPGCYDLDRTVGEPPKYIPSDAKKFSVVTVDPSPTRFWSIQWWLYVEPRESEPLMGSRYLLDMARRPMSSEDFLDWNVDRRGWTGLLDEWWERSKKSGHKITYLIVEQNAAQRFMLRYDWFKRWLTNRSVTLRPHNTHTNKTDPQFGVTTIAPHYRFGRVRFPGTKDGRKMVEPLVNELTRYPDSSTDDCVMAHWFFEFQLQHVHDTEVPMPALYKDMPSWAKDPTVLASPL